MGDISNPLLAVPVEDSYGLLFICLAFLLFRASFFHTYVQPFDYHKLLYTGDPGSGGLVWLSGVVLFRLITRF